jgi:hypothetical protein
LVSSTTSDSSLDFRVWSVTRRTNAGVRSRNPEEIKNSGGIVAFRRFFLENKSSGGVIHVVEPAAIQHQYYRAAFRNQKGTISGSR